jgi:putative ABC transport system permease protein
MLWFPGVAAALGTAALVLSAAAMGAVLFLTAAGDAALARIRGNAPAATTRITTIDLTRFGDQQLVPAVKEIADQHVLARIRGLQPAPPVVIAGKPMSLIPPGHRKATGAVVVSRDGFEQQIQVVARAQGVEGVWLARSTADRLGVKPGDQVELFEGWREGDLGELNRAAVEQDSGARLTVAGIYANFVNDERLPPYWEPLRAFLFSYVRFGDDSAPRPPPILVSPALLWEVLGQFETVDTGQGKVDVSGQPSFLKLDIHLLYYPRDPDLGLAEAAGIAAAMDGRRAVDLDLALKGHEGMIRLLVEGGSPESTFSTAGGGVPISTAFALPGHVAQAQAVRTAVTPGVETVSLAGQVLGLALVGAAAVLAVRRRRTEILVRYSQGRAAAELAGWIAGEAVVPLLAGGVIGVAVAVGGAWLLSPTGSIDTGAAAHAAWGLIRALPAAVLAAGIAGWFAIRRELPEEAAILPGALARPPWELAVLGLAGAALYEVLTRGEPLLTDLGQPARVDRLLILFPLLAVTGLAGLATRALARLLGARLARRSTYGVRRHAALFLAMRRLTAASRTTLLLVTAAAVAFGVVGYSLTLASSARAAAIGKTRASVGSDAAARLYRWEAEPVRDRLAARGDYTLVARIGDDRPLLQPQGVNLDVIGLDPAHFEKAVYWDPAFADVPPRELLARLGRPYSAAGDAAIPALLIGIATPRAPVLQLEGQRYPLEVVSSGTAFPGRNLRKPLLVVPFEALRAAALAKGSGFVGAEIHVWGKGGQAALLAALRAERLEAVPFGPPSTEQVLQAPAMLAVDWTLGPLAVFGGLAALLALAALVLYLQALARARTVSYLLARRMGLAPRAHLLATACEVLMLLGVAALLGGLLSLAASAVVLPVLDPLPQLAPPARLQIPVARLALATLCLPLVAWLAAWLIQRRLDRVNAAEVLRLAP